MTQCWEQIFLNYCKQMEKEQGDASHDVSHFMRVAKAACEIASLEEAHADCLVVVAAAYFHDIVSLPKNHPEAYLSSKLAAEKAVNILANLQFPSAKLHDVYHAIHAHSFSAQVEPRTLEAKIVQDADRLEALGALGVLRTFYLSGRLGSQPYHSEDPFAASRPLNDKSFALDHFYCKLFKLPAQLRTQGGRQLAEKRALFLQRFIDEIASELKLRRGGAIELSWICHHGGSLNLRLFNTCDPFALHRKLQSDFYIVDQLLEKRNDFPFIDLFIKELREEISFEMDDHS
jgi:uncharacterized protein